jgi:acyl-coenzyme A thioesterase PaaI-like protein
MDYELTDDRCCFVCGQDNPHGLRLSFRCSDGKSFAEFIPAKACQGYRDITHGGIITAVLDEAMIQAATDEGCTPVTAEIRVRFKTPLRVAERAIVEAEVTVKGPRLLEATSRMTHFAGGAVIAEAHAKLVRKK